MGNNRPVPVSALWAAAAMAVAVLAVCFWPASPSQSIESRRKAGYVAAANFQDDPIWLKRILDSLPREQAQEESYLATAAAHGNRRIMEYLLKNGWNADGTTDGRGEPLWRAVSQRSEELVRMLLKAGASPNIRNPVVGSPLHLSAKGGQREIVQALLDAGADINIMRSVSNAAQPFERFSYEIDQPRGLNTVPKRTVMEKRTLWQRQVDEGEKGVTPLMSAVIYGQPEMVRLLLSRGASVAIKTASGKSVVDFARKYKQPEIVTLLQNAQKPAPAPGVIP